MNVISTLDLPNLKRIVIGDYCFWDISEFIVDNLPCLESLIISHGSIKSCGSDFGRSICRISNCSCLRDLVIGDKCFEDFQSLELFGLSSIPRICFGMNSFKYADCSIKGKILINYIWILLFIVKIFRYCIPFILIAVVSPFVIVLHLRVAFIL